MPPTSATAPAEPSRGQRTRTAWPAVRLTGAGGTDPHRWPLQVPRQPGEALHGWLWRLAYRYGLTPRTALRLLGASVPPQRAIDLAVVLQQAGPDRVAAQLAVPVEQLLDDPPTVALEQARTEYLTRFHQVARPTSRGTRYCPRCLTETGVWQASWVSPLHAVCVTHRSLLASTCPICQTTPFARPFWLTATGQPWICPGFYDPLRTADHGGDPRRYRGRCRADLRDAHVPAPVDAAAVQAQEHLLALVGSVAHGQEETRVCCGLPATNRLTLEAVLDLLHAHLGTHPDLTSPGAWPGRLVRALRTAMHIVEQANPGQAYAAAAAAGLLGPQDPQAPIGPTALIQARPHSRVLETMTLLALRGRLSVDTDLRFRLGATFPSYPPHQRHQADTEHLHPDQALPELPMSSIPALIWPNQMRRAPAAVRAADPLVARAAASLALAKTASSRRWNLIAVDLDLPARLADPIRRHWRALHEHPDTWQAYLAWVDDLFVRLHQNPPPIDYQARRALASQLDVLTGCAAAALHQAPTPPPDLGPTMLARLAWPVLVGSDAALAPTRLVPPDRKSASQLHALAGEPDLHGWVSRTLGALRSLDAAAGTGPVTWRPP